MKVDMIAALLNIGYSSFIGLIVWIASNNQTAAILSGVIVYCSANIVEAIDGLKK